MQLLKIIYNSRLKIYSGTSGNLLKWEYASIKLGSRCFW